MILPRTINILVADNHLIFREGLVLILNNQADMTVVGECNNGNEAFALVLQLTPDLTILDLELPGLDGIGIISAILNEQPQARILLLTTFDGDDEIRRAMKAGALGYLLKESRKPEILHAIREVSRGRRYLPS